MWGQRFKNVGNVKILINGSRCTVHAQPPVTDIVNNSRIMRI